MGVGWGGGAGKGRKKCSFYCSTLSLVLYWVHHSTPCWKSKMAAIQPLHKNQGWQPQFWPRKYGAHTQKWHLFCWLLVSWKLDWDSHQVTVCAPVQDTDPDSSYLGFRSKEKYCAIKTVGHASSLWKVEVILQNSWRHIFYLFRILLFAQFLSTIFMIRLQSSWALCLGQKMKSWKPYSN